LERRQIQNEPTQLTFPLATTTNSTHPPTQTDKPLTFEKYLSNKVTVMHSKITYSVSPSPAGGRKPLQALSEKNGAKPPTEQQASRLNKANHCEPPSTYEIKSNAHVHHWTYYHHIRNTGLPNDSGYHRRGDGNQEQECQHHHQQRIVSPSARGCGSAEHDGIYPAYACSSSSYCAEDPAGEEPSTPPTTRRCFSPSSYHSTSAVGLLPVTPDFTPSAANILPPDEADWLRVVATMLKAEVPDHRSSSTPNAHLQQQQQQQPNDSTTLRPNDIVCGRGAPTNFHPGNQVLRELVKEYQTSYLCARRSEKPRIAIELLGAIRFRGGRFVRRNTKTTGRSFSWVEIGEKAAYEKVCQYLRDGAPELRRQIMLATGTTTGSTTTFKQTGERGIAPRW
jgi:hypothetical protein